MDELGSGTDPAEGMGIAVAVLEELRKSGALFLVTTHYPEVKTVALNCMMAQCGLEKNKRNVKIKWERISIRRQCYGVS